MTFIILTFLAYLCIFLFGMTMMKVGFRHLAGKFIEGIIEKLTKQPINGLIIGAIATMMLQSSSAVTVIAIGLTASGLLRFPNTVGIILGANIGTTATIEIASFHVGYIQYIFLVLGLLLMIHPIKKCFAVGACLFGIGCLFTSMHGFNQMAEPLFKLSSVQHILILSDQNYLIAILTGTLLSAVLQSSSATTLITMAFLNHGALSIGSAIAVTFGANIGTCVTAYIASLGNPWEAKWTAYTHFLFNVLGVILFYPFIDLLADITMKLSPSTEFQLAHSGVLFNLITALLALPFANVYGRWVENKQKTKHVIE
ncbi:Na/Pi cotransporter family protein [Terrilactibacillus sp. BCM23-1]|uniref:Na/Pi cotransporter family protein n=1 Tax=Terrilactibacillus tamarindi TaxID=2599694 RepID=A0A6N8CS82_9BACI|nr:Na/Pi symporter [Terrilactibacillus tamarindi]MTT32508.1 Na/Pi cotransporter family protein [Terrilactibacillus tamarindi]